MTDDELGGGKGATCDRPSAAIRAESTLCGLVFGLLAGGITTVTVAVVGILPIAMTHGLAQSDLGQVLATVFWIVGGVAGLAVVFLVTRAARRLGDRAAEKYGVRRSRIGALSLAAAGVVYAAYKVGTLFFGH